MRCFFTTLKSVLFSSQKFMARLCRKALMFPAHLSAFCYGLSQPFAHCRSGLVAGIKKGQKQLLILFFSLSLVFPCLAIDKQL
jgi:hypothetical protein